MPANPSDHPLAIADAGSAFVFQWETPDGGLNGQVTGGVGDLEGLFGLTWEEAVEDPFRIWRLVGPDVLKQVGPLSVKSMQSGLPVAVDALISVLGCRPKKVRIRFQSWKLSDGRVVADGIATDITETDHDTQVADTSVDVTPSSDDSTDSSPMSEAQFFAHFTHQLRTPLHVMQGFAQLLAMDRKNPVDGVQRQRLSTIEMAGHRMQDLLDAVKDYSNAQGTNSDCHFEAFDIGTLLGECIEMVRPHVDALNLRICLEGLDEPVGVLADRRSLGQVLNNLLSNAVKYNRVGGSLGISVRQQPGRCRIAVSDEGAGLTEAQISQLFRPFHRLAQNSASVPGSGLGLAISRSLMEQMGGSIQVWSNPGHGTTFEVELDTRDPSTRVLNLVDVQAKPDVRPPRQSPANFYRGAARILYVEDDRLNSLLVKNALSEFVGCELLIAKDGLEAWELILEEPPHLIIADVNMPNLRGDELIRRVRSHPPAADAFCIALSADLLPDQVERVMAAGFDDFWAKPLDIHKLQVELQRHTVFSGNSEKTDPASPSDGTAQ